MYIKELHVNHPNSYAVVHMSYGEITALANGMYEFCLLYTSDAADD